MGRNKMNLFEITYEVKLLSTKEVRDSMNKCIPILCAEHNCNCEMKIKKKWYWLYDVYTIKISGEKEKIKYIEKRIKHLTLVSL